MILQAQNVNVRYGRRSAVSNVSLDARPGEVLALLGANGSGKSSLMRASADLQVHDGSITWDGGGAPPGSIGYMPQDNGTRAALTAFEIVLLGRMRTLTLRVGNADLEGATAGLQKLSGPARAAMAGWLDAAQRRIEIDQRIAAIRAQALAGLAPPTAGAAS